MYKNLSIKIVYFIENMNQIKTLIKIKRNIMVATILMTIKDQSFAFASIYRLNNN